MTSSSLNENSNRDERSVTEENDSSVSSFEISKEEIVATVCEIRKKIENLIFDERLTHTIIELESLA